MAIFLILITLVLAGAIGYALGAAEPGKVPTVPLVGYGILLLITGFAASIFVSSYFSPKRVIACPDTAQLSDCALAKAKLSYDSGDGIFTITSFTQGNGEVSAFTDACVITAYNKISGTCKDTAGKTWQITPAWR